MDDGSNWFEARGPRTCLGGDPVVVHAKTYGTTLAACGSDTIHLIKRWDRPFLATRREACSLCVQALAWSSLRNESPRRQD